MSIHRKFDELGILIELLATNDDARRANATPDLYEACEVAILALTHRPINPKDIDFIKQALAKADSR